MFPQWFTTQKLRRDLYAASDLESVGYNRMRSHLVLCLLLFLLTVKKHFKTIWVKASFFFFSFIDFVVIFFISLWLWNHDCISALSPPALSACSHQFVLRVKSPVHVLKSLGSSCREHVHVCKVRAIMKLQSDRPQLRLSYSHFSCFVCVNLLLFSLKINHNK